MAQQTIGIGAAPNDGTGDPIRTAFDKCNDNFTELYAGLTGLLDFKGSTDCSASPNYPAANKGDYYLVSVAGKIGGPSGVTVEVGDSFFATADNAGGAQGSVGTSWTAIQGNISSYLPLSGGTLTGDLVVPDEAYDATAWNGSLEVPTKNAVRDKIESLGTGSIGGASGSTDNAILRADGIGGATLQSSAITIDDSGALGLPDGVRQIFNPDATTAGLNVGAVSGDPSSPSNGDIWYDNSGNKFRGRENGANVDLRTAGGSTGVSRLTSTTAATGTPASTTETDLLSYTMPGGTLANNGSAIRIIAAGTLAATTRSRTVRFYFGSTVLFAIATSTAANVLWRAEIMVIRTDGTNQRISGTYSFGAAGLNAGAVTLNLAAATETLSGSVVVKVTGQSAGSPAANDVVGNFFMVELIPA